MSEILYIVHYAYRREDGIEYDSEETLSSYEDVIKFSEYENNEDYAITKIIHIDKVELISRFSLKEFKCYESS